MGYREGIVFLNTAGPHRDPVNRKACGLNFLDITLPIHATNTPGLEDDTGTRDTRHDSVPGAPDEADLSLDWGDDAFATDHPGLSR
eukprot:4707228-Heterocapsa_arctica.AAC.1